MAETLIEWADYTFNPWIGCTKISPACDNCYAERDDNRHKWTPEGWGAGKPRHRTKPSTWKHPHTWNNKAKRERKRFRVFCASLADIFDNEIPQAWRDDLWTLIAETPHLDWLLLTKRIGNARYMMPEHWYPSPPSNVWMGATIVNAAEAMRDLPKLAMWSPWIKFVSMEPLLEPVNLEDHDASHCLDWVIVGGETGAESRFMSPNWARLVRTWCVQHNKRFFFKQMTDMVEIPQDLRIREVPDSYPFEALDI